MTLLKMDFDSFSSIKKRDCLDLEVSVQVLETQTPPSFSKHASDHTGLGCAYDKTMLRLNKNE